MKKILVTIAGFGMLAGVACGSSPNSAVPVTTTSTEAPTTTTMPFDLAKGYLDAVAPTNVASATFTSRVSKLNATSTPADFAALATPLAKSIKQTDEMLLRLPWTAVLKPDVNVLVTADMAVAADLLSAGDNQLTWLSQYSTDVAKMSAAISILRADLGLSAVN